MKIIKPSFEIWERDEQRGGLAIIERAGKVCYKSKPGETPESAENFARSLIRRHHNSVLEHGDMIFEIGDHSLYDTIYEILRIIRDRGDQPPMLEMTSIGGRDIISGNIRAWRELFATGCGAGSHFASWFDPVFVQGYGFFYGFELTKKSDSIRQIFYKDLREPGEKRAHLRQTVSFICDRGVMDEYARHRTLSPSVESTRYCDYSADKNGQEINVIDPCFSWAYEEYSLWKRQMMSADVTYVHLRKLNRPPQECRGTLPLSVKTQGIMTGNLRAWDHFFDLRARQITGPAHPQAAELAVPLMQEMAARFPDVIDGA